MRITAWITVGHGDIPPAGGSQAGYRLSLYAVDGVGIQLVAGVLGGSVGASQMVTDPSGFFASLSEVSCWDPSCETGWIGPHCRLTGPPGLVSVTNGPGAPLYWIGVLLSDSCCSHLVETLNEYVVALVFGSTLRVGGVAT